MHLKQKGYSCGVLVIFTVTTITLQSTNSLSASGLRHNDRRLKGPVYLRPEPQVRARRELLRVVHRKREHREATRAGTSGGTPDPRLEPTMVTSSDKPSKSQHQDLQTGRTRQYRHGECKRGEIRHMRTGKFFIIGRLETNLNMDRQVDSTASGKLRVSFLFLNVQYKVAEL